MGAGEATIGGVSLKVAIITLCYAIISSTLAIVNKWAIVVFPFPGLLTCLQYLTCIVAVVGLGRANVLEHDPLERKKFVSFAPAAIVFALAVFTNMKILQYANVDTFIVFRSSTPLLVALSDSIFMGKAWPNAMVFASLASILMSATAFTITDSEFSVRAYSWAFAYVVTITSEMVYIKHVVSTIGLNTWGLVLYNNIYACILAPFLMASTGELSQMFLGQADTLGDGLPWYQSLQQSSVLIPVLLSCLLGLGISFFGFACRRAISATAFTVVGVTNKLLTVLINVTIWDKHASPMGILCLCVCIFGGVWYQQATSIKAVPQPSIIEHEAKASPKLSDGVEEGSMGHRSAGTGKSSN